MTSYQIGDQLGKMLVDEKMVSRDTINAGLEKQEKLRSQKNGDYLQEQHNVTQQQVEAALISQKGMPQLRLGDTLIRENIITEKQLSDALQKQLQDRKMHLGDILVDIASSKKETIKQILAQKLGIPLVVLSKFQFEPNLIRAIPINIVHKHPAFAPGASAAQCVCGWR